MRLRTLAATLVLTAALSGLPPARVAAQTARGNQPAPAPPAETFLDGQNAAETRIQLRELLNQLPPSLGQVLRLDPSLLSSAEYLASYPRLAAFLKQHTEVVRNPSFFLGDVHFAETNSRQYMVNALKEVA